jgi:hypothetical protein
VGDPDIRNAGEDIMAGLHWYLDAGGTAHHISPEPGGAGARSPPLKTFIITRSDIIRVLM